MAVAAEDVDAPKHWQPFSRRFPRGLEPTQFRNCRAGAIVADPHEMKHGRSANSVIPF
jgi:hypothetical protein